MVNIKDIAKLAGVSISTVSNVINGKKNVGLETRNRIIQLCNEMSYYPNMAGRSLKTNKNKTILFNFSDFDRSFYLKIIAGISDYASDNDYDFIICTHKSCEKYMRNSLTCGCIILDAKMTNEVVNKSARENYPIIILDRILDNKFVKSIIADNYNGMRSLVLGLLDSGYKDFAFVGGLEHTDDNKERYKAFLDTLESKRIIFKRENYFSGDYREKSGSIAAKIFMLGNSLPDILVCANDNMAVGAMKTFRENGLRVPEDIAVTGFDNSELAETIGLTTVEIPNYERGYLAALNLIESLNNELNLETIKIPLKVIWRKTTLRKTNISEMDLSKKNASKI